MNRDNKTLEKGKAIKLCKEDNRESDANNTRALFRQKPR